MIIIGCDFHPSFQQIAMLDTECGTTTEHKLMHTSGEAERFLSSADVACARGHLPETSRQRSVVCSAVAAIGSRGVGRRCTAQIRASYVRKQKDGSSRRWTHPEAPDRGTLSAHLGARRCRCETIGSCWFIATSWSRYVRVSKTNCSISCSTKACRRSRSSGAAEGRSCTRDPFARSLGRSPKA